VQHSVVQTTNRNTSSDRLKQSSFCLLFIGGSVHKMAEAQQIDISQLPLEQLALLKSQFEQDVEQLGRLLDTIREAISRFEQSSVSLRAISPDSEGQPLLVPMTSSLYVPGRIKDVNKVMIDVGTGYFVEKTRDDAIAYVTKKLEMLYKKENEAEVDLMRKRESLKTTMDLLQIRVMEIQQTRGQ